MLKIAVATQNKGKLKEIIKIMNDLDVQLFIPDDLSSMLGPETGKTFKENAEDKALQVAKASGNYAIADDSGLEVDFLNGSPGVFSARFAGEKASDEDNISKLLKLMKAAPGDKRTARFTCAATLSSPAGVIKTVVAHCEGEIVLESRGDQGFGYDPVFQPKGYTKTMAELGEQEKNRISHRGKAFKELKNFIQKEIL